MTHEAIEMRGYKLPMGLKKLKFSEMMSML